MTLKWQLDARQHPAWKPFLEFMLKESRPKSYSYGAPPEIRRWDWELFRNGWEAKTLKQEEWIGYPIDQ